MSSLATFQMSLEGRVDAAEQSAARLKGQVDDMTRQLNDLTALKARLTQENFDLQHQVQELDSSNAALAKAKSQLQAHNDDLKRNLDDESRVSSWVVEDGNEDEDHGDYEDDDDGGSAGFPLH